MLVIGYLFAILVMLLWLVPVTIFRGLVISKLWLWHVVPVFHLMELSVSQAVSVSLIVAVLTFQRPSKEEKPDVLQAFLGPITINAFALVMGWLIHVFQ